MERTLDNFPRERLALPSILFVVSLGTHILLAVRFTKGISYSDAGDSLVVGKVFGQKRSAFAFYGCLNDHGVPERQAVFHVQVDPVENILSIVHYHLPVKEVAHDTFCHVDR